MVRFLSGALFNSYWIPYFLFLKLLKGNMETTAKILKNLLFFL